MAVFNMQLAGGIQVPAPMRLDDEYIAIRDEMAMGSILRESALFRVWRIKFTAAYEGTEETVFAPRCATWNDFVKNVAEYAGVSRSTLYSRIRLYELLGQEKY